jgi:3-oxoadipate enol-lactonase/4-carboxymuconolactone decarboxylase
VTDYRWTGAAEGPVLVVSNSLGADARMWREQLPALGEQLRLLLIDHPGHGEAAAGRAGPENAPATPPATIDELGQRVLRILDEAGVDRAHYLGLSLGGMVGLWLAANAPERVDRLAVCCTTAYFGTPAAWRERAAAVRANGTGSIAAQVVDRWVTADYGDRSWLVEMMSGVDDEGYAACCDALAGLDLRDALPMIAAPTLVVAADEDRATPVEHGQAIADAIPGARLRIVPGAHLAPLESPDVVTPLLVEHFTSVRRQVLGDAHVDRAQATTTPFTADFQDFISRYAWGDIWTRPGLDRRTRSAITLAMLAALQHEDELAMHVRAALRNGMTVEEIKEVLLQVAVYAGVPTANRAFRIAERVLSTLDTP